MNAEPADNAIEPSRAVVINADDFGKSTPVNQAIARSFDMGLISTATLMANMPGFDEAVDLVRSRSLEGRIGVHLNLTEGTPLTDDIKRCPRLCSPDGAFVEQGPPMWHLRSDEAAAVEAEMEAQVELVRVRGITATHIDSHHHVHTRWAIASQVLRTARQSSVSAVRLSRNCGPIRSPLIRSYKRAFNARLRRAGLARTRYFGSAADVATLVQPIGPVEVMVHPGLDAEGRLVDHSTGRADLDETAALGRRIGDLVTYQALLSS